MMLLIAFYSINRFLAAVLTKTLYRRLAKCIAFKFRRGQPWDWDDIDNFCKKCAYIIAKQYARCKRSEQTLMTDCFGHECFGYCVLQLEKINGKGLFQFGKTSSSISKPMFCIYPANLFAIDVHRF